MLSLAVPKMKKISIVASSLATAAALSAVAVPVSAAKKNYIAEPTDSATYLSMTYTELFDILNGDEYYVSMKNEATGEVKTVARKKDNTYVSTTDKKGVVTTKYVVEGTLYTVDDDEKTITTDILNVPVQDVSVIDYSSIKFEMADEGEKGGTVEQFKAGKNTEYYYFNANKELTKVVVEDKYGDETTYTITAFDDEVPSELFTVKKGYEVIPTEYKLKDTRVMTVYDDMLNKEYTMAYESDTASSVVVKSGYDFYSNEIDKVNGTNTKKLALGSLIYTFNDAEKTYTKADRRYDDQAPAYVNTLSLSLKGIERVAENGVNYIVETVTDNTNIYKFYWNDKVLEKIECVNNSNKLLDTIKITTFSASADKAALTIPSTYTEVSSTQPDISLGEGEGDNSLTLETTPVETEAVLEATVPAETEAVTEAEPTTTVIATANNSPKTGQSGYAALAAGIGLASVLGLAIKSLKTSKK